MATISQQRMSKAEAEAYLRAAAQDSDPIVSSFAQMAMRECGLA